MRAEARPPLPSLFRARRLPECLCSSSPPLVFESPLTGGRARLRRDTASRHGQGGPELLDEPLDGELAVARLAPFVLGDCPHDSTDTCDDAALLGIGECARRLDVEHRLDARRRLLRVLPARAARARDTEVDLR